MSFECSNCGKCCGPVPVTKRELAAIKQKLKSLPKKYIKQLRKQNRDQFICPLRDVEKDRCSVYEVRPEICRMMGEYIGLQCHVNPQYANKSRTAGETRLKASRNGSVIVGTLAINITWDKGL